MRDSVCVVATNHITMSTSEGHTADVAGAGSPWALTWTWAYNDEQAPDGASPKVLLSPFLHLPSYTTSVGTCM